MTRSRYTRRSLLRAVRRAEKRARDDLRLGGQLRLREAQAKLRLERRTVATLEAAISYADAGIYSPRMALAVAKDADRRKRAPAGQVVKDRARVAGHTRVTLAHNSYNRKRDGKAIQVTATSHGARLSAPGLGRSIAKPGAQSCLDWASYRPSEARVAQARALLASVYASPVATTLRAFKRVLFGVYNVSGAMAPGHTASMYACAHSRDIARECADTVHAQAAASDARLVEGYRARLTRRVALGIAPAMRTASDPLGRTYYVLPGVFAR